MRDEVGIESERCAELVAPILDRLRLAIMERVKPRAADIAATHGVELAAVMTAAYLRNVYPAREFRSRGLFAVFTYQPQGQVSAGLEALINSKCVAEGAEGSLTLTDRGLALVHDIVAAADDTTRSLWPETAQVEGVRTLAERAVGAIDDGGDTVTIMAPEPGNQAELSSAGWVAELITALRFHRFDCHIAAWTEAGLTAEQVVALEPGPQRDAIEHDTNRRAATPYRALEPSERLELLAGLGALPG